jgi:hypothetical protein
MAKAKASGTRAKARGRKAASSGRKAAPVDFSDADSVKVAMAKVLDVPEEDIEISDSHYDSFRTGDSFWKLEVGRQEYYVAENEEAAEKLAIAVVKQDLEESPENFNQNFIESHIDLDRLRRDLMSDVESENYDLLREEATRQPIEFMKEHDIEIPEPTDTQMQKHAEVMADGPEEEKEILAKLKEGDAEDKWIEMGEEPEVDDSDIEQAAASQAEEQLKNPLDYLEEIYGREDAVKKAIEIAGIDEDAAAEEAVRVDGAGHFLSSYDGNVNDGPDGLVYWRHN